MAFLLSLWEGCRGEGSSCRPRCEATAAILDEAAEEVVPVSHEPLFRHPSSKDGEKRCPVSGQAASAGTCPFAKPKAKAAPAKGPEQLPSPATEVKEVKETASSSAPRGAVSSVPEPKKADTAEKPPAAKASVSQKGQQPQKQPRQSSSASGQQRSQSSSRKSSKPKKPPPPPPVYSDEDSDDSDFGCPASKQEAAFEKELKALKKKVRSGLTKEEKEELDNPWLTTEVSDSERKLKKEMFISFYREQYKRLKKGASPTPDIQQYEGPAGGSNGFTAQGGHKPMPRPKDVVVPPDFRKPVGRLSSQELARFGCDNPRMLISIHGDIFDISDRPDKYGPEGPYYYMAGHDITWGLVVGEDSEETMDRFYDIYKVKPKELMDRKLQGLMSWWAFYEKEYGAPVGRLTSFDKEWGLPPPPHMTGGECSVM